MSGAAFPGRQLAGLVFCLCLLSRSGAVMAARTLVLTDAPIAIRLQYLQPTAVTLPEAIASVPTGADPAKLSLELDGARLFLQALDPKVSGRLFAVGVSGRIYPIRFQVGSPADTNVTVLRPAPSAAPPQAPPSASMSGLTLRSLLAAMIRAQPLSGVTEAADAQTLLDTERLHMTTVRVYVAGAYLGYQAQAVNRTDAPLPLALPAYYAPGLKAISADVEIIPPRGTATVYLVFQPGAPY